LLNELREGVIAGGKLFKIYEISASNMGLFEGCSFQDLTGLRITKVVKSLIYVEDRVDGLIES